MKRHISILIATVLALASIGFAQQTPVRDPANKDTFNVGMYYAPNFGKWHLYIAPGSSITATGSQTFLVSAAQDTTPDGVLFVPFVVNGTINVGTGTNVDTVVISAVSGCTPGVAVPGASPTCSITATSFSNNHYAGEPITSADNGLWEAFGYAQEAGGGVVRWLVDCGQITLSTSAATTTSSCLVPKQFYGQGASAYVNTAIATATNWAVGISGSTSAFCSANSTLAAGTTCLANMAAPALVGSTLGTGDVLITTTGSQTTAGVVHVKLWGYTPVQGAY
jgi:hypothetical protein